jgi:hypothetical protein
MQKECLRTQSFIASPADPMKLARVLIAVRISALVASSRSKMPSNFVRQLSCALSIEFSLRPIVHSLRLYLTEGDQMNQPTLALWALQLLIFVATMLQILLFAQPRTLLRRFPAYIHR